MKTPNNIKKLIAALLSTAVILGASSVSGIPVRTNAVAEPAEDGTTGGSGIITGGKDDANDKGYHWKYITGKNPDYNRETDPPYNEYTWADSETTWSYDPNTKTLTIGGTGSMPDWNGAGEIDATQNPDHYFFRPWGSRGKIGEIEDARKNIERIVIEEGVASIGSYAFCNFNTINTELTIEIPDTVTKIGRNAFYHTHRLKSITIPDSVETIDREAFWHSKGLENVKLSDKLTELGEYVFCDCAFSGITIPQSVKKISNYTFKDCKNLKTIEIPENVTALGWGAFSYCSSLEKVTFKGTTTIPTLAIPQSPDRTYQNVFIDCPCVADDVKGLIIESCAVLKGYQEQHGWSEETTNYKEHIDKTHNIYYTAEGAVITEKCTNDPGCHHTATATLSIPDNKTWFFYDDGNEIKPVINTYSDNWLGTGDKKPADSEIQYKDNTLVGTAEATLTITNDDGTPATSKIGFDIVSTSKVIITADGWEGVYDGNSHSITVQGVPDDATVKYGTEDGRYDLTENPDYTNVGEYTVYYEVTLTDGSKQTGSAVVKITPKPITDEMVTVVPDLDNPDNDPTVTVKDGDKTLTPGIDYDISIEKITDTNTGETETKITITGKGNYTDTVNKTIAGDSGDTSDGGGNTPGTSDTPGGNNPGGYNPPGGNNSNNSSDTSDDNSSDTSGDDSDTSDNSNTSNDSNDTSDDNSDTSNDNSGNTGDPSGTDEPNHQSKPGGSIEPGNVSGDSGTTTPDTSKDDDKQNPITGNPIGRWVWILVSAAGATGIAVMKSKSNRKKN